MTDNTTETQNRCYRHPDRESFVRCQRCGRTICGQCQTAAAVGVHCPECMRESRQSAPSSRPILTRAARALSPTSQRPVITYAIIAIAVVVFALQVVTGQNLISGGGRSSVTEALEYFPFAIYVHPWAILTVNFVHAGILHIASNMYFLFLIGPPLERYFGRWRFIALFVVTSLGADVAVDYFLNAPTVGASGAIFGLLGVALVFARRIGFARGQLVFVILINLALGFFIQGIAWEAHIGGFVIGILLGFLLRYTQNVRRRTLQIAGIVAVTVVLLAALLAHILV